MEARRGSNRVRAHLENARPGDGRSQGTHPTLSLINPPTLEESTIVERVARIVSSVRGARPDYTRLAAELEPAIPLDVFGVVLLRHDREALRVTVCQREGGFWKAQRHQRPLADSKVEQLLQTISSSLQNEPFFLVENYPGGLDGPPAACGDALSGFHQLLATFIAPLVVGDRVLGTLELGSTILHAYEDETLQRLIRAVVRVLAAAIEGAQVGGSAEIQDRQRQVLKDVSTALTSKMDLSSIFNQIVVGIAKALNVSSAIITLDQREGKLRLEAQSGLDLKVLCQYEVGTSRLSDQSIIGYTLRRRQPCVSHDISTDERFPLSQHFATQLFVRSVFSYPLVTGTTVYGALLLCSPEPGGFTPLKADILSLFASQATIAIHNAMLIESAHQRSRFQDAIEQLEQAHTLALSAPFASRQDEHDLLERVRQESEQTFGIRFSSLLSFMSEHLLTRNERDLHSIFHGTQRQEDGGILAGAEEQFLVPTPQLEGIHHGPAQETSHQPESIALLGQMAEAALARAAMLSELSRLLTQIQHTTGNTTDAWFVVGLNGICITMNSAAEVFCGMRLGAGIGTDSTIEDVFAPILPRLRNAHEVRSYLHKFSQEGQEHRQDLRCILAAKPVHKQNTASIQPVAPHVEHRNGKGTKNWLPTDHHYHITPYPLYNQQGVLIARALQVHDVTDQVRDENNKSALLSSVSHDLRTPLTTIKAAVTGLLQNDVVWDEQTRRAILEDIDTEADHLAVLVVSLIEMSRIEMGALVLEKEWCDIVEVIYGALGRLERVLGDRSVEIRTGSSLQFRLPLIYADHVQLDRVFYNLIENAVRRSPEGSEILITLDVVEVQAMSMLQARVIDRGTAIAVDARERIFTSFYSGRVQGSGLELAICRGIVEAHQGRIKVEETPAGEAGACFTFMLPLHPYNLDPSDAFSSATKHEYECELREQV